MATEEVLRDGSLTHHVVHPSRERNSLLSCLLPCPCSMTSALCPGRCQGTAQKGWGGPHPYTLSWGCGPVSVRGWRRKWQPTPVFLPGESQGRWSLVGCRLWGHSQTRLKRLSSSSTDPNVFPCPKQPDIK